MLDRLRNRLHTLRHRERKEAELDAEIAFHLSEEADERRASGISHEQARQEARRDFGSVARARITHRAESGRVRPIAPGAPSHRNFFEIPRRDRPLRTFAARPQIHRGFA